MAEARYKIREITCGKCGVRVVKPMPECRKFCSTACSQGRSRPNRKTGTSVACGWCGKIKYAPKNQLKRAQFCGKACHNAHQGREKTIHKCQVCLRQYRRSPSTSSRATQKYCSIACRDKCPEFKRTVLIGGNLKQQLQRGPNRLELKGYAILDLLGIPYEREVLIAEKFTVDVLLREQRIIIQWDGDYWHGYRAPGDATPLQPRQLRRRKLDSSQDSYMAKSGYTVLRFWEHEVHETPDAVADKVREMIQTLPGG